MLKVPVSSEDHILGAENSSITLVEYGDYQCPYCGMAYPITKAVKKHYGNQLRFVFRHFPLTEVHPFAESAAETAEFANEYHQFWEMHNLLFENQESFESTLFFELAQTLKLPAEQLEVVIRERTYESKIKKDFLGGVRSGVNGTPTFFINDQRYEGPIDFKSLVLAIDSVLV